RLLIVGDGPERAALEELARSLGVGDAVELAGAVDPADVPSLLHRMHVAVAPYPAIQDFYFSPLKVYEYLAAGLPIIASRVGSIPEALAHGEFGVLVDPGDPAALATAIAALRDDPARRTELGRAARHAAVRDHDWSRVVDRILDLAGALDVTV
ncbi:MAG TPA: glycosyltransferase, partial [Nocardioidaceae bacterium]